MRSGSAEIPQVLSSDDHDHDPDSDPPSSNAVAKTLATAIQQLQRQLSELQGVRSREGDRAETGSELQHVRLLIGARRSRAEMFPDMLFSDPAWEILLELYARKLEQHRINISRLTSALPVPATTTLRWLDRLLAEGLIIRTTDVNDKKRIWVEMSQYGCSLMERYFKSLRRIGFF